MNRGTYQTTIQHLGQSGLPLATWSPCKLYRYTLRRVWRSVDEPRVVTWVLLNPSTADEFASDPTIRRCIAFSQAWGFDELMVVNTYGVRSTDPRRLQQAAIAAGMFDADGNADPVGPGNDAAILIACARADLVVCGWGKNLKPPRRTALERLLAGVKLTALQRNDDGSPAHPLYLKGDLRPQPFTFGDA